MKYRYMKKITQQGTSKGIIIPQEILNFVEIHLKKQPRNVTIEYDLKTNETNLIFN